MTDTTTVRPGQIWQDNDPRAEGRTIRIVEVDQTHARAEQVSSRNTAVALPGVRKTRIRLDRFRPTSTGYRLVKDVNP